MVFDQKKSCEVTTKVTFVIFLGFWKPVSSCAELLASRSFLADESGFCLKFSLPNCTDYNFKKSFNMTSYRECSQTVLGWLYLSVSTGSIYIKYIRLQASLLMVHYLEPFLRLFTNDCQLKYHWFFLLLETSVVILIIDC